MLGQDILWCTDRDFKQEENWRQDKKDGPRNRKGFLIPVNLLSYFRVDFLFNHNTGRLFAVFSLLNLP